MTRFSGKEKGKEKHPLIDWVKMGLNFGGEKKGHTLKTFEKIKINSDEKVKPFFAIFQSGMTDREAPSLQRIGGSPKDLLQL